MNKIIKSLWLWGPVLVWAGLIFYLSSLSSVAGVERITWDFFLKKSAHMGVYGMLYLLLVRAMRPKKLTGYVSIFVMCFLYGISDEIHQSFVPGRTPNIMDVGFDSLGASIAYLWTQKII